MTIQVVNGYICRNCTDVDRAKKGLDPARADAAPPGQNPAQKPVPRPGEIAKLASSGEVGTRLHVIA